MSRIKELVLVVGAESTLDDEERKKIAPEFNDRGSIGRNVS